MFIILNLKRVEASLEDVTTSVVGPMIPSYMRGHQPLNPATQVAIALWPEFQVKMIVHQAIPDQSHLCLFVSLMHKSHKGREVLVLMKNVSPTIAPVKDVIHKSTLRTRAVLAVSTLYCDQNA